MRLLQWLLKRAWARFESSIFTRARYSEPKMVLMGVFGVIGFPTYWAVWALWFPQPYESLALRLLGSVLFLPLIFVRRLPKRWRSKVPMYWYFAVTYALPFFFTYMLLQNGANTVWLLSHLCSVFLLVMLFDVSGFLVTCILGSIAAAALYALAPSQPLATNAILLYSPVWLFAVLAGSLSTFSQAVSEQSRIDALTAASNNIAHELRTPLASVRIATSAVQRYLPMLVDSYRTASAAGLPVPELRESHLERLERALASVEREIEHANTVIDMLLIAARPIGEIRMERVSAKACVEEALERYPFGSHLERSRVTAYYDTDFELLGSRLLVVHVLFNLIKNALFHTSRAGKGEIELRVTADAENNRIVCRDTGPGIPSDVLPRIFDRFYSSATDVSTGLGIGLAFVRGALERMRAPIHCRSVAGEFTEFTIVFPSVSEENS